MKAWFCIPSARPAAEANKALRKWSDKGYGIALWRDDNTDVPICNLLLTGKYPGYAQAVNALAAEVLAQDPGCQFIVDGGDDTTPDPNHSPSEIAQQCVEHFGGTFGVMQPTGDRWANGSIDRIAGSAWMGREWCERANQGLGPLWHEYFHNFVDDELQNVAIKLGVFWQRPDLIHHHEHWIRAEAEMPQFLKKANSSDQWAHSQRLFNERRNSGFPGHAPLILTR